MYNALDKHVQVEVIVIVSARCTALLSKADERGREQCKASENDQGTSAAAAERFKLDRLHAHVNL